VAPVSLLGLNLLACMVHGLPQAIRRSWRPFTVEMGLSLPERGRFYWPDDTDASGRALQAIREELGQPRQELGAAQEVFLYERGRFRPLGPYCVHLALLLILLGGLLGKFWGIEGRVFLREGDTASQFQLEVPGKAQPLNFEVRLDRFQVRYYPGSATPQEFRSDLTFMRPGLEKPMICRVNEPVTFDGYTFYQSSYGQQPAGPLHLEVTRGDRKYELEAPLRQWVKLPGGAAEIMAMRLEENLQGYGPAAQFVFREGPGHPASFWVVPQHPELAEQPPGYRFHMAPPELKYYSVLQVKHDPGVPWIYAGFLLLLPGFYLAFFHPTQRWAVVLQRGEKGRWEGRLRGAGPRDREAFMARTERLLARLKGGKLL
jgi:cytochrome c biogenesis protein